MILETNNLDQIRTVLLVIVFEILFDDFFEPINNKLLFKRGISL